MFRKIFKKVKFLYKYLGQNLDFWHQTHCLKITQNVAFEFLNFGIFHQIVSF